jgi:hypothetical protein
MFVCPGVAAEDADHHQLWLQHRLSDSHYACLHTLSRHDWADSIDGVRSVEGQRPQGFLAGSKIAK